MKKLFIFVGCLILCFGLLGCSKSDNNSTESEYEIVNYAGRDFMVFDHNKIDLNYIHSYTLYVDCETKVQYLVIQGDNSYCATAITIVDETGTPILWEE